MGRNYMRFPEFKAKAVTLSYDDGVQQDEKFIRIIDKYGLKCTFNINSALFRDETKAFKPGQIHRRMTGDEAHKLYANSGHEVAVHTLTHQYIDDLPVYQLTDEILNDRKNLEAMFEREVRGMAYPYGICNDRIVEVCRTCGIAYSRTVKSTNNFEIPHDWLRLDPTCHHASERLFELTDKFLNASEKGNPLLFYLWGHTYEFEADDNWDVIEKFGQIMGNRDNVWYATNIEIYEYVESFRAVRFFQDGKKAFNPTCQTLYFVHDKQPITINPGETVTLE